SLQCTQRQVVLFGPSGAGKSLTLKAVAGLLRPGQGHVRLQGQTLFDAATASKRWPTRGFNQPFCSPNATFWRTLRCGNNA
ncbi:ATP-binding cassette domain-containing protein, partial [Escherichia coli]|uniref:ATP-binding cassette domain-containing protein n=1 Tax=Escherichia coli TaxID=562 RepID=UPI003BA261D1